VALAFAGPGSRDDAAYTAQIYAGAMGGGMSSRLFQELREARGLCYTVFAQASAYADTGAITLYGGTGGRMVRSFLEITVDELRRAADDLGEAEVGRARAQMKAGLLMGLESCSSRAERNARMVSTWGRVPPIGETVARIEAVDLDAVRDFAGRLCASRPALTLLGPVRAAPDLDRLTRRLAA
jgi:predicted Zn-dependent peptidase